MLASPFFFLAQIASAQLILDSGISVGHLGDRYAQRTHIGYSVAVAFTPSENISIGVSASFANPTSEYDLIGFNGSQEMHFSYYELFLGNRIGPVFSVFNLSSRFGVGITVLATDERSLSVGALGVVKVPSRSERAASYSVGLTATRELFPHVSIFLSPRAFLVSPIQVSSLGYSIVGGLSFGIF